MNDLLWFALDNTIAALVLAVFVYGLTRVWRNPPAAHVLWLLVLLKLVAPPVLRVDWSLLLPAPSVILDRPTEPDAIATSRIARPDAADISRPPAGDQGIPQITEDRAHKAAFPIREEGPQASSTGRFADGLVLKTRSILDQARPLLCFIWFGGAGVSALVAAARIARFERQLRGTLPASARVRELTERLAAQLGVARLPDVRVVEGVGVPLVWCPGRRPTIVLPLALVGRLDERQLGMILAHELAHLRRRDHWLRGVELIVSILYWWNPLVAVIRRQIHKQEDLCCDAWVRLAFPQSEKLYAEVLLQAAESIEACGRGARLLAASPFLDSRSLKGRIEMILENRFAPRLSARSVVLVGLAAILFLPSFLNPGITGLRAAAIDEPSAQTPAAPSPAVPAAYLESKSAQPTPNEILPYVVSFEQGATRFVDGDKITIAEVRGTAPTFTPGNIYWVKGTYVLSSHDKAQLSAYVTATESGKGTAADNFHVRSTVVNRGSGSFALFLLMSCRGWPHVSFYPADGGGDFGGNYFGTGDSVLKQWWGDSRGYGSQIRDLEQLGGNIAQTPAGLVIGIVFAGSPRITDEDIWRLQAFKGLTTVGLGHTSITDAGLEHLAEVEKSRFLFKRTTLIAGMTTTQAGFQAYNEYAELTTLYIDNTRITDAGVKVLVSLPKLTTLGLGHTRTTDVALKTVGELGNLTTLYIDNTRITDAGLEQLKGLKHLTTLGLGHTATTDAGLKTVREHADLTTLYIDNTKISDAGLEEVGRLKNLTTLGLGHTATTDAGLKNLAGLTRLRTLYLDNTRVSDQGIAELKQALPDVRVIR